MTNAKINQLFTETTGLVDVPSVQENEVIILNDTIMQTFAERVVAECIAAVDTGDVNVDTLVANQINNWFGITAP